LLEHKVEAVYRDFFKQPFTQDELEELIGDRPITDFISTRAKSYKSTGWDNRPPTKKQAIAAMLKDPTLLRRPILRVGKSLIVGWSESSYTAASR